MKLKNDKQYLAEWQKIRDGILKATPVDYQETTAAKAARIDKLAKSPEDFFTYYFPNFCTAEPAPFHKAATRRVVTNPEWSEVRSWSRELAKSTRTMMEVLYLTLTGKKKNVLLVSNSFDNAERLLLPYKTLLESNARIANDYGKQEGTKWETFEFVTKGGVAFRALGAGQSPRGTRNDNFRPDVILIDDIDTDEECRNPERIKTKLKWVQEALIPTRSISGPLLLITCGNIIAKFCCVTELGKKADKWDVVNILDKLGNSTWPQKNKPEHIRRVLSQISHNSAQKEYFNNPVIEGDVFKEINYGTCPPPKQCDMVVGYADPSTSNKDRATKGTSYKSLIIVGVKAHVYYIYRVWLQQTSNAAFVGWFFAARQWLAGKGVDPQRFYIENNSLQDPFYTQVIRPLFKQIADESGSPLPGLVPDTRKKPEKFDRIEGTLEPEHRNGNLVFDEGLKGQIDMQVFEDQFLAVAPNSKTMDGPDALEGAVHILKHKLKARSHNYIIGERRSFKY